jgi:hypothetical protein
MTVAKSDEPVALAATEPGFVDLFPELDGGTDLGVVEYFPPGSVAAVDLTGDVAPDAA